MCAEWEKKDEGRYVVYEKRESKSGDSCGEILLIIIAVIVGVIILISLIWSTLMWILKAIWSLIGSILIWILKAILFLFYHIAWLICFPIIKGFYLLINFGKQQSLLLAIIIYFVSFISSGIIATFLCRYVIDKFDFSEFMTSFFWFITFIWVGSVMILLVDLIFGLI